MTINLIAKVLPHNPVELEYINGAYVVRIHDSSRAETYYGVDADLDKAVLRAVDEYSKEDYVN